MRFGLRALSLLTLFATLACADDAAPIALDAATFDVVDVPAADDVADVATADRPDVARDVDPVVQRGAAVFRRYCAHCHGARGAGTGDGPDLRREVPTVDDAEVLRLVRDGGRMMPAIPIDEAQRADVLAYLRATFGAFRGP